MLHTLDHALLGLITRHLDQSTLLALAQTCLQLHALVLRHLYRSITLTRFEHYQHIYQALVNHTVQTAYLLYTTHLTLRASFSSDLDYLLHPDSPTTLDVRHVMSHTAALLLSRTPNLVVLTCTFSPHASYSIPWTDLATWCPSLSAVVCKQFSTVPHDAAGLHEWHRDDALECTESDGGAAFRQFVHTRQVRSWTFTGDTTRLGTVEWQSLASIGNSLRCLTCRVPIRFILNTSSTISQVFVDVFSKATSLTRLELTIPDPFASDGVYASLRSSTGTLQPISVTSKQRYQQFAVALLHTLHGCVRLRHLKLVNWRTCGMHLPKLVMHLQHMRSLVLESTWMASGHVQGQHALSVTRVRDDIGVEHLEWALQSCTLLSHLVLDWEQGMDSDWLDRLIASCPALRCVVIGHMPSTTTLACSGARTTYGRLVWKR
jgi:hypothetical protein